MIIKSNRLQSLINSICFISFVTLFFCSCILCHGSSNKSTSNQTEENPIKVDNRTKEDDHVKLRLAVWKERKWITPKVQELVEIIKKSKKFKNLEYCYSYSKDLNMMRLPPHTVIFNYIKNHKSLNYKKLNKEELRELMKTLGRKIIDLLKRIYECMHMPAEKRTTIGLTGISYMSKKQYKAMLNWGLNHTSSRLKDTYTRCEVPDIDSKLLPKQFDWGSMGYVTRVKAQKNCGSCYIFAAVAATETGFLIHKRGKVFPKQVDFSEQAYLNCDKKNSCNTGGIAIEVFEKMQQIGLVDQDDVPYVGKQENCRDYKRSKHNVAVQSWCLLDNNNVDTIKKYVLSQGPIIVAVDASNDKDWQDLEGPFNRKCSAETNHAMALTGWSDKYWIIKNSWSEDWGILGYLYLPIHGECDIEVLVAGPVVTSTS